MDNFEKLSPDMLQNVAGGIDKNQTEMVKLMIRTEKRKGKTKEEVKALFRGKLRSDFEESSVSVEEACRIVDAYYDSL